MRASILPSLCCLAAIQAPPAQDELPRWKIDPHTGNDPELMAEAGYVSFGPFGFGGTPTRTTLTTRIDDELDPARILWAETAHFRIGSALEAMATPSGRDDHNKIREELTRLAEKLPRVSPATRTLGPWLRLHLLSQRLEDLYAELQDWLGVTDADFPANAAEARRRPDSGYMGEGPYLGQPDKYLVLVLEDQEDYFAYMRRFLGMDVEVSQRWNFAEMGSLFFGTATELRDRRFKDDTALHCHLVFNVTHNLIDGYRFYAYDLPVWITEGVSHRFERSISPRWNTVTDSMGAFVDRRSVWQWESLAGELIAEGNALPFTQVYRWRDPTALAFEDHVLLWSRMDFLMSRGKASFARLMAPLKRRKVDDILATTRDALGSAYGLDVAHFDEQWIEWVRR